MKTIIGLIIVSCCLSSLGGCTAALVGGSLVGGYYVGKEERKLGRVVDDATITAEINALFVQDETIETLKIDVDTYQGVVTLSGDVPSQEMIDQAIHIAKNVSGVEAVNSLLVVENDEFAGS